MTNICSETQTYFNPATNYERVGSKASKYAGLYFYDAKTGEKLDLDLTSVGIASRNVKVYIHSCGQDTNLDTAWGKKI